MNYGLVLENLQIYSESIMNIIIIIMCLIIKVKFYYYHRTHARIVTHQYGKLYY